MSNKAALQAGTARAKKIIQGHISMNLQYALDEIVTMAVRMRRDETKHNMTGNTVNSYAGGLFIDGVLKAVSMGQPGQGPLEEKLRKGGRFKAEQLRWDGDLQQKTFKAEVDTDGRIEPASSIGFINSYNAKEKGFEVVICDGVEYATYQENVRNIDVLTGSFSTAASMLLNNLKPLPE